MAHPSSYLSFADCFHAVLHLKDSHDHKHIVVKPLRSPGNTSSYTMTNKMFRIFLVCHPKGSHAIAIFIDGRTSNLPLRRTEKIELGTLFFLLKKNNNIFNTIKNKIKIIFFFWHNTNISMQCNKCL